MATLPQKASKGRLELGRSTWLVYGQPGIGKSTFANSFPRPLFGITERTQEHLKVFPFFIDSWEDYLEMVKLLKGGEGKKFQTIVIDTIDLLYKMCQTWAGEKWGFDHPGDEGHGKGWDKVNSAFHQGILALKQLRKTVIFVAHYKEKEVKARGANYTKTVPFMTGSCWRVCTREADVIAFCDLHPATPNKRIFRFLPEMELEAKDRGGVFPLKPGFVGLNFATMKKAWGTGPGPVGDTEGMSGKGPARVRKGAVKKKGGGKGPQKKKGPRRTS